MALVIGIKIVAVNDAHGVIELQTELKAQTASGIKLQHPALFHLCADAGGNFHSLTRLENYIEGSVEIITCRTSGGPFRKLQFLIDCLNLLFFCLRELSLPGLLELIKAYFMEFSNFLHLLILLIFSCCAILPVLCGENPAHRSPAGWSCLSSEAACRVCRTHTHRPQAHPHIS